MPKLMIGSEQVSGSFDKASNISYDNTSSLLGGGGTVQSAIDELSNNLEPLNYYINEINFEPGNCEAMNENDGLVQFCYRNGNVRICGGIIISQDLTTTQKIFTVPLAPKKQHWLVATKIDTHLSYLIRLNVIGIAYPWGYDKLPTGLYSIDTIY